MNTRMQMLCLWCGPAAMVLFFIGFWGIAGLVPPPSPDDSALEIRNLYTDNTDAIRIGLVITMVAGALTGPFAAAICAQMKRIEGDYSPLSYTELGMGMLGVLLFIFPTLVMQVCAFRPDTIDPNLLLSLNDLAWIPFVGIFAPAVVQNIAIGLCRLQGHGGQGLSALARLLQLLGRPGVPARGAALLLQDRAVRLGRRVRLLGAAVHLRSLVLRHVLRDAQGDPRARRPASPGRR